ncbi:uncharacterized protein LOC130824492 [Amaranthus tricolor]|uniref:uncharacterized protein LOC130824492 n=1 Tax=Amaranthus tricolor TaxID=29722 RepID=UPI00258FDC58|nr:uncharacterized protein LOC130824492 [Amaranthus tricolor]
MHISNSNKNSFEECQTQYFDDESISLRDLPITAIVEHVPHKNASVNHSRRSSASSSSDPTSDFFFEILINNDDDLIIAADDVIFHGRLLPFAPPPPRRSLSLPSASTRSPLTESSTDSLPAIRPSRSLNCRKSHRNRSNPKPKSKTDLIRRFSSRNENRSNFNKIPAKFPWYWLVFGLPVKIQAEMELKDIQNRKFRRNSMSEKMYTSNQSCCSSASWKFLNVLSCKSHATVDVMNTAPFPKSLM